LSLRARPLGLVGGHLDEHELGGKCWVRPVAGDEPAHIDGESVRIGEDRQKGQLRPALLAGLHSRLIPAREPTALLELLHSPAVSDPECIHPFNDVAYQRVFEVSSTDSVHWPSMITDACQDNREQACSAERRAGC